MQVFGNPILLNPYGGNVGLGTTNPTQKLHVVGSLRVTGQIVYGAPDEELPDYVFEPDYKLMPVEVLAAFLAKEKHLPNIPPASEIKENGLNLGEFQMKLLEKIEELTLYKVRQAKAIGQKDAEIAALKSSMQAASQHKDVQIGALKAENDALDARLAAVEQIVAQLARKE